jgi:hypothetical protein
VSIQPTSAFRGSVSISVKHKYGTHNQGGTHNFINEKLAHQTIASYLIHAGLMAHITTLPMELLLIIVSDLTSIDLVGLRCTCTKLSIRLDGLLFRRAIAHRSPVYGYTALHWASKAGNASFAQKLLSAGVPVSVRSNTWLSLPLHVSAFHGTVAVAKLLLSHGADVNAPLDGQRASALHLAACGFLFLARPRMVQLLINHGADVAAVSKDASRSTPLHVSFYAEGDIARVQHLLLFHGSPGFKSDGYRDNPLSLLSLREASMYASYWILGSGSRIRRLGMRRLAPKKTR